jgi:uncharacterized protein YndB with AHSA1/START domain
MTTTTKPRTETLTMRRRFKAPRERVFQAFTDLDVLRQWWGPEGMDLPEASLDLKVGGAYDFHMRNSEGGIHRVRGIYRDISEPEKLVFTWQWVRDEPTAEMLITLTFHDHGNETELEMLQEKMPDAESVAAHEKGWSSSFNCLERFLAS